MEIYIALIVFVFVIGFFTNNIANTEQRNKIIVALTCLILFFMYILRDYRVGVDLEGYLYAYDNMDIKNYYDTYLEKGYVFAMELCNKIGLTFRGFLCLMYLIFFIPFAKFLNKYSKDVVLSLIIFICYNFLVFTLSGVRQTIATGICIIAFMVAQNNGKKALIEYIILIFLAMQFHKSSFVFLPAYYIMRQRIDSKWISLYIIGSIFAMAIRVPLVAYLNTEEYTNYQIEENLTIGSTFYLTVIATIFAYFLSKKDINDNINDKSKINLTLGNFINLIVFSILIKLLFSGTIMMRAAMYYEMFIMIMIPNMLCHLNKSISIVIKTGIIAILILIFYITVLTPKQFNIVPYIMANSISLFK